MKETYLGDGAYIKDLGHAVVIYTTDGVTIENEIYLEGGEIRSLLRFLEDTGHMPEAYAYKPPINHEYDTNEPPDAAHEPSAQGTGWT